MAKKEKGMPEVPPELSVEATSVEAGAPAGMPPEMGGMPPEMGMGGEMIPEEMPPEEIAVEGAGAGNIVLSLDDVPQAVEMNPGDRLTLELKAVDDNRQNFTFAVVS